MRPAALLTFPREGARVIAPRMTARVAERGTAAARAAPALVGRKMLLGRPELTADSALGVHARSIGWLGIE